MPDFQMTERELIAYHASLPARIRNFSKRPPVCRWGEQRARYRAKDGGGIRRPDGYSRRDARAHRAAVRVERQRKQRAKGQAEHIAALA